MLDDKDDQIEELIQEVNKLQEEKSSPFTDKKNKHGHTSSSNMTSGQKEDGPITIEVQAQNSDPR